MFMSRHVRTISLVLVALCWAAVASAQIRLTLDDKFIDDFKNRVVISADLVVDHSHPKPNPPSKDGDIHAASRSKDVGLPFVAEIMNSKEALTQVNAFHDANETDTVFHVEGAWRLWCEHGGQQQFKQNLGQLSDPAEDTNPDHCFEIHPITDVDSANLRKTWHPIVGFTAKNAEDAFTRYEQVRSHISHDNTAKTTTIDTAGIGFNYVKFKIALREDPTFVTDDGLFVRADVLSLNGDVLVRGRRMAFVKGTSAFTAVMKKKKGGTLTVLGIPRIDLALVAWRVEHGDGDPRVLDWNLPYEMIIVGSFGS
jgi:hypothetical protein